MDPVYDRSLDRWHDAKVYGRSSELIKPTGSRVEAACAVPLFERKEMAEAAAQWPAAHAADAISEQVVTFSICDSFICVRDCTNP